MICELQNLIVEALFSEEKSISPKSIASNMERLYYFNRKLENNKKIA